MRREPSLQGAAAILWSCKSGHGIPWLLRRIMPFAEFTYQLDPISAGHPDIADQHLRLKTLEQLQCLDQTGGLFRHSAAADQDSREHLPRIRVIVDDEDASSIKTNDVIQTLI